MQFCIVKPDLTETFSHAQESAPKSRKRSSRSRSKSRVMAGDHVTKDLEDQPRQLKEKKLVAKEKKRKRKLQ